MTILFVSELSKLFEFSFFLYYPALTVLYSLPSGTQMRVIANSDGVPVCYHCIRPFDVHPTLRRRQERYAALCAIKDDDHAARAFHYFKQNEAEADRRTELWVERHGFDWCELGSVTVDGIRINLLPEVSAERAMEVFDKEILPAIRESIRKTLDGTAQKEIEQMRREVEEQKAAGTLRAYDPTWCPATPSAQELYPNGYVRKADGSVESL